MVLPLAIVCNAVHPKQVAPPLVTAAAKKLITVIRNVKITMGKYGKVVKSVACLQPAAIVAMYVVCLDV
jgi:hypothetical protein